MLFAEADSDVSVRTTPCATVTDTAADVEGLKVDVPVYDAVRRSVPAVSDVVLNVATPEFRLAVPITAAPL
jgi:hypothetical protein